MFDNFLSLLTCSSVTISLAPWSAILDGHISCRIEVITDSDAKLAAREELRPGRSPSSSACLPYREAIELGLSQGRNAIAIWQDLVDASGFTAAYQSVRRFVRKLEGSSSPEAGP